MRFHAKYVSVGEFGDEYFEVSFDSEDPGNDDLDLSGDENPYLIVQRQFEDGDGGVCFAFEIARKDHKYVEVTYDLDAKRFDEVQRIVRIIFGVQS